MDEGEARSLLEDCLRVMFHRDCHALNRIQIAKATADGTLVSEPYEISTEWETACFDVRHANPNPNPRRLLPVKKCVFCSLIFF